MLKRSRVRREVVRICGEALARELVENGPSQPRRSCDEEHLLGREEHRPQDAGERRRPTRDPVDADPLPTTTGALADERDLDGRGRRGRVVAIPTAVANDHSLDAGDRRAPPDDLGIRRRPVRPSPGEQDDRLEQAGLASGVRTVDELRAAAERRLELGVTADVAEGEGAEQRPTGRSPGS